MKKLIVIVIIALSLTLLMMISLAFGISEMRGREFHLVEAIIFLLPIYGAQVAFILWTFFSMCPSLRYLESNSAESPVFKRKKTCSSEIDVPKDFDFNRLKTEISEKMVITFCDDNSDVLKFRNKWKFSATWGAGAWIKYDSETQKLYLECFPLEGRQDVAGVAPQMQKDIENCLELNDLFELTLARYGKGD